MRRHLFTWLLVAGALGIVAPVTSVAADDATTSGLIKALKGKPKLMRSFTVPSKGEKERSKLIKSLKNRNFRAISVEERKQVTKIVKEAKLPSVDLEIRFAYNSAAIRPESIPTLNKLGAALSSADLKSATFLVGGHTDARGSNGYNQTLSERRAAAVKQYLTTSFGVASSNLIAIGFGEEQLKNPVRPDAAENRRVQIVNFEQ